MPILHTEKSLVVQAKKEGGIGLQPAQVGEQKTPAVLLRVEHEGVTHLVFFSPDEWDAFAVLGMRVGERVRMAAEASKVVPIHVNGRS